MRLHPWRIPVLFPAALAACGDAAGPGQLPSTRVLVAAAADYSCAVDTLGRAWCWGSGREGQLGSGDSLDAGSPVPVVGGLRFAQLSTGDYHACGLTEAGQAWCWGTNFTGVLGIGQVTGREPVPRAVVGGHTFVSLSAGGSHTCGLTATEGAWCWGQGDNGQLGNGDTTDSPAPVQ
ncbi:MAG TPA: hypothetical protein VNH46_07780, partial [Gemmatimonadales bacterium]|nr:hypothetical protein [Gemmatimonadales bacterium]